MPAVAQLPTAADCYDVQPELRRALVVCDQWLGGNGYAGMKALRRAGWSAQVVAEWESIPVRWQSPFMRVLGRAVRPLAVHEFNRRLEQQAILTRPELLLVFKGAFVQAATLEKLRSRGIRCLCFYPDVSFRTHGPYLPSALRHYDWIFTTKSFGLRDLKDQLGISRASLVHHAFDPDLHRPVAASLADVQRYGCDVSFIGTWSPKKERILRELHSRLPALHMRIWGEQWTTSKRRRGLEGIVEGRAVEGEEYVRAIVSSKINLGILSEERAGSSAGDQITSRTFHIPACGGFMLHERTAEVREVLHEPSQVACFSGMDELVMQVSALLEDDAERAAIAARGRERIGSSHSWDHRIREIVAVVDR